MKAGPRNKYNEDIFEANFSLFNNNLRHSMASELQNQQKEKAVNIDEFYIKKVRLIETSQVRRNNVAHYGGIFFGRMARYIIGVCLQ